VLNWLRSRSLSGQTAAGLYGSIVAQARNAAFYAAGGAPDTMEGRFGMIGVHMFLVLERIRHEGNAEKGLGRALIEAFVSDMDDSMREIGIGDMGVPRRVKKAAAALHEHLDSYRAALSSGDDRSLAEALRRYVFLETGTAAPQRLASYMRTASADLDKQPWPAIARGHISFPTFGT